MPTDWATAGAADAREVRVWDAARFEELLAIPGYAAHAIFAGDDALVTGGGDAIRRWRIARDRRGADEIRAVVACRIAPEVQLALLNRVVDRSRCR